MSQEKNSLLQLDELSRFDNLLLFAKAAVDGYFSGRHKSSSYGSSAQFKDYRSYQPGDELNRVDWRAYAKSGRLLSKQFDSETDMIVYLFVDVSASMAYAADGDQSKVLLANRIAAALSYLMINSGDKVALVLFDEKLRHYIPPSGTRGQLFNVISSLENCEPRGQTDLLQALTEAQGLFKKRGRMVILSDFWGCDDRLFEKLSYFLHKRYEVLLMQILDETELSLPAYGEVRFVDMESQEELRADVSEIRALYQQSLEKYLDRLNSESENRQMSYCRLQTDQAYLQAIEAYLGLRGGA